MLNVNNNVNNNIDCVFLHVLLIQAQRIVCFLFYV